MESHRDPDLGVFDNIENVFKGVWVAFHDSEWRVVCGDCGQRLCPSKFERIPWLYVAVEEICERHRYLRVLPMYHVSVRVLQPQEDLKVPQFTHARLEDKLDVIGLWLISMLVTRLVLIDLGHNLEFFRVAVCQQAAH